MNPKDQIDEAMFPLNEHVRELLNLDGLVENLDSGIRMEIFEATVESPVQLEIIVEEDGKITLGSSPPLYYELTSIMPVFHAMKITMTNEEE